MSSIIEHILSSRHKDAELISRYKIPGVMLDSFCSNCKCILKYKKSIYNHIASYKNHCINYYSIQLKKHVVLKKHKIRGVYCEICNCYVNIDNIEEHLDSHEEVCYYFNKGYKKNCFNSAVKECKWAHKCEICKGDHPRIECFLRKEQNKISGAMVDSFCNDCECKLKYNKSIYNHMVAHKYHSINFYFIQLKKHVVMKINENKEVYCDICNCYISIDDVERHLDNHDGACYYFNKGLMKNHAAVNGCKWHHKCGICRGDHPWIACSLKKEENIIPILGQEKSKFGLQHEYEMIMPNNSYKKSKQNDKVSEPEKNLDGELIKVDTYDSLLPENADVSKVQKNLTTRYYKHNEDEYESNTSKQLTKSDIQDRITYPDEKYRNVNKSYKGNKLSRSSSKNSSNRTNNISISKSDSINGRYSIKEHSPRRQLSQSGNKQEVITNSCLISIDGHSTDIVHSGDEDGEFNLITAIVKLLEICDLLGNLGYFFANTLNNALEKVKSEEDILNILREHANIILMEVILKKN